MRVRSTASKRTLVVNVVGIYSWRCTRMEGEGKDIGLGSCRTMQIVKKGKVRDGHDGTKQVGQARGHEEASRRDYWQCTVGQVDWRSPDGWVVDSWARRWEDAWHGVRHRIQGSRMQSQVPMFGCSMIPAAGEAEDGD